MMRQFVLILMIVVLASAPTYAGKKKPEAAITTEKLQLRFFPIERTVILKHMTNSDNKVDVKGYFIRKGINWPRTKDGQEATIRFDKGTSQLVCRNTQNNVNLIKQHLAKIRFDVNADGKTDEAELRKAAIEELKWSVQRDYPGAWWKKFDKNKDGSIKGKEREAYIKDAMDRLRKACNKR